MRRFMLGAIVCCLVTATAAGDIIWLQNGKKYEGKVTRKGGTVVIEMRFGTIEVRETDVLRIVKAEITTKPKTSDAPKYGPEQRPFDASKAVIPESVVFYFMRKIAASQTGLGESEDRHQVRRWRDAAHDRVRKVAGQWLGPKEFTSRRETFDRILKEAVEIMRQRYRIRGTSRADLLKKESLTLSAVVKMKSAAMHWPDPLLKKFLTGVAHYEGRAWPHALRAFEECVKQAPLVPAFHQGHGLALLKLNRTEEALPSFIKALQLAPDSKDALQLLRDGMKAVPGTRTHSPEFEQAKEMVSEYKSSRKSSSPYGYKGVRWILPGKYSKARDNTLPVPEYHRLVFHQGVGVAIGKHALLVDTKTVANAAAIIVEIDGKYVTGKYKKSVLYWRGKGDPPVSLVTVSDYSFSPVSVDVDAKFSPKAAMTAHAMNFWAEMGDEIHVTRGPLKGYKKDITQIDPVKIRPGDSTAPVLTADKRLVGFRAAKTDVREVEGGPDKLWTLAQLERMIDRGVRIKPATMFWVTKRTIVVKPAKGNLFKVHGVFCETLNVPGADVKKPRR